ncbi:hypothetical protein ABKN59_003921 [Abortiporus biennis]
MSTCQHEHWLNDGHFSSYTYTPDFVVPLFNNNYDIPLNWKPTPLASLLWLWFSRSYLSHRSIYSARTAQGAAERCCTIETHSQNSDSRNP